MVSSSPVFSIGADEIFKQQEPEVEKILRLLPITIPGDNQNVNNGTDGIATVDLRGLGAQRSIVLMNGQRMTPATAVVTADSAVDISTVPTALIERVDILTGGASTVYGSDAVAGAVNFVMKRNFSGVDLRYSHRLEGSESNGSDGNTGTVDSFSLTLGGDIEDGRGNVVFNFSYTDRKSLLLEALPFGNLGINTAPDRSGGVEVGADGMALPDIDPNTMGTQTDPSLWVNAGLASYLSGGGNIPPEDAGCSGPGASDSARGSGSTTAIPTRVEIVGAGGTFGQFRNDRTIGDQCSRFNFNPYNFFQTPQEKYSLFSMGRFELNDWVEAYSQLSFSHITVEQQVAPSGTFGNAFWVPVSNPLIGDQARQAIIAQAVAEMGSLDTDPTSASHNWRDENGDGTVNEGDYLRMLLRRRTFELGFRSERYESDYFQMLVGARGDFAEYFNYDVSFSYGQSNRTTIRDGYTNVTNIQNALDVSGTSAEDAECAVGSPCVPLDLFGGFGTITPEMAAYVTAIALQNQKYEQRILTATVGGAHPLLQLPTAASPLAFSAGFEIRNEEGRFEPDECLKLAPASCQGGAGGNLLPFSSSYKATDYFVEAILPVLDDVFLAKSLQAEAGFRTTDYDVVGSHNTWKFGFNWRPVDELLVRVMSQQAIRGPNIGELAAPQTTGLDNAQLDPCSSANLDNLRVGGVDTGALLENDLVQRCRDTGQTDAQIGDVDDVISNQLNDFRGTDLSNLPTPEQADTFTLGLVWTPSDLFGIVQNPRLTVDYYDIDIDDLIGVFSAQSSLDSCYERNEADACARIRRVAGALTLSSSGVERFTTNLEFLRAEGLEVSWGFDIDLENLGKLNFAGSLNTYLTHEFQESVATPVLSCKGNIATDCDGVHEFRMNQRITWDYNQAQVSLLWRHLGELTVPDREVDNVFTGFRKIDSYNYFDLFASYSFWEDRLVVSASMENLLNEDPPIVGQDIGSTSYNYANTLPSHYDFAGRIMKLSFRLLY